MRRTAIALVAAGSAVLATGACADLIGANFGTFEVEETSATGASSTSTVGSSSTGDAASTGAGGGGGDGGGGGAGGAATGASSSTGAGGCQEWPDTAGVWRWAAQYPQREPAPLDLDVVSIVPSNTALFPWIAIGNAAGPLLPDGPTSPTASPFAVPMGPSGPAADLGIHFGCEGDCNDVSVWDGSADRSTWNDSNGTASWLVGSYRGAFQTLPANENGLPATFTFRLTQQDGDTPTPHKLGASTFLPSINDGVPDAAAFTSVSAAEGLVALAGAGTGAGLISLPRSNLLAEHFFFGLATGGGPFFFERRSGWIGTGSADNTCGSEESEFHTSDVDVAIAGSVVWLAGHHCGRLIVSGLSAVAPGDGFVARHALGAGGDLLNWNGPLDGGLAFGANAKVVAAVGLDHAVAVGETDPGDLSARLPNNVDPQPDQRGLWIGWMDAEIVEVEDETGELVETTQVSPRWVIELDGPGDQHVHDVVVQRIGADEEDVAIYVAGTTEGPLAVGPYTSPCEFEGERIGFVARLEADGTVGWIRTFGRQGAGAYALLPVDDPDRGVAVAGLVGFGPYELAPAEEGARGLGLVDVDRSLFVGELTP